MEPEFAMMLSYLQELNYKKKPNYKMLRSQFEVMKERNHLKYILEWAVPQGNKDNSISPRSEDVASKVGTVGVKSGPLRGNAP
jgi:hypothetical protein